MEQSRIFSFVFSSSLKSRGGAGVGHGSIHFLFVSVPRVLTNIDLLPTTNKHSRDSEKKTIRLLFRSYFHISSIHSPFKTGPIHSKSAYEHPTRCFVRLLV